MISPMEVSYDADYYWSELQDEDDEYLQDSDDYYQEDLVYNDDDELDNDLMSFTDYFEDIAFLDEGEESHQPQAFF
jgi:hypothetical protein